MTQRRVLLGISGVVLVAALGIATWSGQEQSTAPPPVAALQVAEASPLPVREVPKSETEVQLSFAPIVREVTPAVVNVYATKVEQGVQSPFADDPFFSRFFGGDMFQSRPRTSQSLGSGVIVDPVGIIVTNSHVVHGADDIRIALSGGREYAVRLLLDDPKSDLAVLKIADPNGRTFPALRFADSDSLEVGDLVLAVGNPFGVGQTVTSGIVSALARTGVETGNFDYFIQTDAAINPGNSGGALVDLNGNLVGINTAIFTRSGGSVGIGFAIPANMARTVAAAAVKGGTITRPWFGARLQEVTTDIADSLSIDPPHGALIAEVAPDSPAERAGLQAGDAIIEIDGVDVDAPQGFEFRFATKDLGSQSSLTYVRSGKVAEALVDVAAASGEVPATLINGDTRFAGASVSVITAPVAQEMNLPFDSKGIVVTEVAQGSPADRMGLQKGDVIVSINGETLSDVARFRALVGSRTRGWQIVLQRGGQVIQSFISG
ncbi:MAG: DegQ family serine endoprotease [Devosia sp.]